MIRIGLILFIFLLNYSCNNIQDGSIKLSEQELYNFGLEPDTNVYNFFRTNISPNAFNKICEETEDFRLITIAFTLTDSIVTECEIKNYSYLKKTGRLSKKTSSETQEIFKNALLHKKIKFSFIDNYVQANYDFRLHLNKYCQ